ncbi:hypothetical protein BJP25_31075 [Actinokineospora bangkokensis]|uniref:Uncharacterized protein n=1 Tax=Actinokineospora bangkokensis TaxID=1193682 RepID=A0A1Q9LG40_9PSEU|nr:hypothetical protein BJP25_31075 [Actinokineospora bangkokensis]
MDVRRTLHLTFTPENPEVDVVATAPTVDLARPGQHPPAPTARERVLVIAEHLVGGWAPTLRAALLMLAAMVGFLVFVALVVGPLAALIGVGGLAAVISTTRRR